MVPSEGNRRKRPLKRRIVKKERRENMLLVAAASQVDIYLWAGSILIMALIIMTSILVSALI